MFFYYISTVTQLSPQSNFRTLNPQPPKKKNPITHYHSLYNTLSSQHWETTSLLFSFYRPQRTFKKLKGDESKMK